MDFEKVKIEVLKAYTATLKYLSYRPRSEKEIRDKLIKKHTDPSIIEQVIEKLKQDKFLNDTEFAQWWIEQRQDFKGKSKFVIKRELLEKGIDNEIIESVLSKSQNDYETAKDFLKRKQRKFERYAGEEYKKKVSEFLQRKGFRWDVIKEVLKNED